MAATPTDPNLEFVEKIKADLKKSGFPLEAHILNICSTKNTGRMPSLKYEYLDKVREIDLFAFYETIDLAPPKQSILQHTSTNLIIECKKSESKPWVFLSSPAYSFDKVLSSLKYFSDLDRHFAPRGLPPLLAQIYPKIKKSHCVDASLPRCFSYYEAFKGPDKPSEIYAAVESVTNYLSYRYQSRVNRVEEAGTFSEFYVPIVVLEGRLFEASINGTAVDLRERSHLQLRTWRSEAHNDLFVIDIVTRDKFQEFFDDLEQFHNEIVSAIKAIKFPPEFKRAALARTKRPKTEFYINGFLSMMMHDAKQRAGKAKSVGGVSDGKKPRT
jgi:hypothetical protein